MANENIVGSLFGFNTDAAEQAYRAQQEAKASAWADRDTQGKFGLLAGRAAESFRSDVPRLFGVVPPEIRKASAIQEALMEAQQSGASMDDPAALYPAVVKSLQKRGLTQEAFMVAQEGAAKIAAAREAKLKGDKLSAETDKLKLEADPVFNLYKDGKLDPATWERYQAGELPAAELKLLANPNNEIRDIGVGTGLKQTAVVNKNTGEIVAKVGSPFSPITSKTNVNVPLNMFDKLQGVRKDFIAEVKPYDAALDTVGRINDQLALARKGNPKAAAATRQELVSLFGDSQKAAAEIAALAAAGSVSVRIADKVTDWLSGVPTAATLNDIQQVVNAVNKGAKARRELLERQYQKRTDLSPEDMEFVITPREKKNADGGNKSAKELSDEEIRKALGL